MSADRAGSPPWRAGQARRLLAVARGSVLDPVGFGWLDDDGRVDPGHGLELWINARMTYVFAEAHRAGLDGTASAGDRPAYDLAAHGVRTLAGAFHDDVHGGWFGELDLAGRPVREDKDGYEHAFVLLAAAAAAEAGIEGAPELLAEAARVHAEHFWDEAAGACVERWSRDWTDPEDYRGANSNMHAVEAYLRAAGATGDPVWRERALRIATLLVDGHARAHGWRLPEHHDATWRPLPAYNQDRPADPFRPYGATPGHALEWSRLLVELADALSEGPADPPGWLVPAARSLVDRAVADGVTEAPGLPYTTDWEGRPVVAERFHWVLAEAVQAATTLARVVPDDPAYAALRERWWGEIDRHLVDHATGSWRHELSATMGTSARTWRGRPDAYHAWNALTLEP